MQEEENQANQSAGPVVNRVAATEEETESDDSGPPGLMDMDGNIMSSSSEDEEELGMRLLERQNAGTPGLTDSTANGDSSDVEESDSDTEGVARVVREGGRQRLGRLNLPGLLNGMYEMYESVGFAFRGAPQVFFVWVLNY